MKRALAIAAIFFLAAVVVAEPLRISASIPARAIVPLLPPALREANTGLEVAVSVTDSAGVVARVRDGEAGVGMLTRNLKAGELNEHPALVAQHIGTDALVLVVHAANPLKGLTSEEVRAIWSGSIENWRELGGPDLPIRIIGRSKQYDPIQLFGDFMKLEARIEGRTARYRAVGKVVWGTAVVTVADSDDEALETLRRETGAISYFPIARLLRDQKQRAPLRALRLDGVEATPVSVGAEGTYYLRRTLNVFTKGDPNDSSQRLIRFLLSPEGQQMIARAGFMPLTPTSP